MSDCRVNELEKELNYIKEWMLSNTRRIDDIEANAFFLENTEEVLLVTIPKKPKTIKRI
jgi:hypothetical protein